MEIDFSVQELIITKNALRAYRQVILHDENQGRSARAVTAVAIDKILKKMGG